MEKKIVNIIKAGYKANATEDQIKRDMFDAGVDFSKLQKMYNDIALSLGIIVDPKTVTAALKPIVENSEWESVENYAQFEAVCAEIMDEVDGATLVRVKTMATSFCKANEIVLPAKPAAVTSKSIGGKAMEVMVALFIDGDPTKQECFDAVLGTIKATSKDKAAVAMRKMNTAYTALYAVANGITLHEAGENTRDQPEVVTA
ncbi:MAG: hypothetical protein DRJ03_02525 [Chloroflexi bacterium]|nr:MAG: hypothetical protein DRJ03_02525 [Chloroflexota bacterium]